MSKRDQEDREREKREHKKHDHDHKHRRDRDREDSGDDPRAHAKIIERRWLGSPPPTPERYAHALRQWHALPGAVALAPSDVGAAEAHERAGASPARAGSGGKENKS